MKTRPIGVYDSGVGGLTVLQALISKFPNENFVYFGDTANLPYGNKSKDQILNFSSNIISWFQNEIGAKLVVAACHTSSALAVDEISSAFHVPIIGTIRPLLRCILDNDTPKNIGIIATPASATSRMHEKIFMEHGFLGQVRSVGCPDFVPFIEAGDLNSDALTTSARNYLSLFDDFELDTLIYGCTHYPLIKSVMEEILPSHVQCIDPAQHLAQVILEWLEMDPPLRRDDKKGRVQFYCSHDPQNFAAKIQKLIGICAEVREVVL